MRSSLYAFAHWAQSVRLRRKLAFVVAVIAVVSAVATYVVLSESPPFGPDNETKLLLIYVNLAILLVLGAVVARGLAKLWAKRRQRQAGSRLHSRMVLVFGLVAVTPAILVTVFAMVFLGVSVKSWFNEQVRTAVRESRTVAELYLAEHQLTVRADVLAMATDLSRNWYLAGDLESFNRLVSDQAVLRNFTEVVVFEGRGRVLARRGFSYVLPSVVTFPRSAFGPDGTGQVAVLSSVEDDRVRAMVRLDRFADTYLYVARLVDPKVIDHLNRTRGAVAQYNALEQQQSQFQLAFAGVFAVITVLLLLAAIWVGLSFANRLSKPISALVSAAEAVRVGDLSVRVEERTDRDELGVLSRAFNRMTLQLATQRQDLVEANRQLDARRRFTEAVLEGVSAGVVGLDADGQVELPNRVAAEVFGLRQDQLIGMAIAELMPGIETLLKTVRRRPGRIGEQQLTLERDGVKRIFMTRVRAERSESGIDGFVVTFNDITDLISAQRTAAWADVARRIAHEIKNPLTPIQLSAERLKRKYLDQVSKDPETFSSLTDTIVRQVGDIGRMVDEFSAFARMPAPSMKACDLREICREAALLQRSAHPDVVFEQVLPEGPVSLICDRRQLGQALTNLLQNAIDAIAGREAGDGPTAGEETPERGHVRLTLIERAEGCAIVVDDNGRGLPRDGRDRLTEPYVTTRARGTGLGLAIVKKIMEDHGGVLTLEDGALGGASVSLRFSRGAARLAPGGADTDIPRSETPVERPTAPADVV